MKGEQANYVIPLAAAFEFPPKKRIRKALTVIQAFAKKHTRSKEIAVSNEVNELLHKNAMHLPRRVNATLRKEETRVIVFLEEGKELKEFLGKKEEMKKKKKEAEAAKKKEEKEKEKSGEAAEEKKRREEKKAKEDAAKAADMKRKTG